LSPGDDLIFLLKYIFLFFFVIIYRFLSNYCCYRDDISKSIFIWY